MLSHGKVAKRIADMAIDAMQDVQNLRKAIYECVRSCVGSTCNYLTWCDRHSYKLKVDACDKGSAKYRKLMGIGINYLYVVRRLVQSCSALLSSNARPGIVTAP